MAAEQRTGVLVTDARERSVVAAIRALDAAGYRVATAADVRWSPGQCSRSCSKHHRVCSASDDRDRFVDQLEEIVRGGDYAILLIGTDASLLAVSEHRTRLEPYVQTGLPTRDAVRRALSKVELSRTAEEVGFRTPTTIVCENGEQARAAARELGFPVIAKAASAVIATGAATLRPDTRLIRDVTALDQWLSQQSPGPSLIQARERGSVYSCAGVMTTNGMVGFVLARYLRTWPREAGNASFAETISPPDGLRDSVARLLDRMAWQGIFELELMGHEDRGFVPIDLNPRLYGSLALTVRAGASLPALWCDVLLGRPVVPQLARPGVCYRWEEGEVRNLVALARRGSMREAVELLRPRPGCAHADVSRRDPGPLAARALLIARRAFSSARRRNNGKAAGGSGASGTPTGRMPAERWGAHHLPRSRDRTSRASAPALPVAIVGAGPYGLAIGAHLRHVGVPVRQFGRTMSYWREQMPSGMLLRSELRASSISDPHRSLRLEHFAEAVGRPLSTPIELSQFIDYGDWFQRQTAPDLDERLVARIERDGARFTLTLEDDEQIVAARVVVAAGLFPFARRPSVFAALPRECVSHASEHVELSSFRGRSVAVVGSGQSALESAALLREQGAEVEILGRATSIIWLANSANGKLPSRRPRWPKPPTGVGGRVTGWIAATPGGFRLIPSARAREIVAFRCNRPAGAGWLPERLTEVALSLGRTVTATQWTGEKITLMLDDGTTRSVDHVLLGTGYEIDVRRYPILNGELIDELQLSDGWPVLHGGLESSVPGLHFVGAPAARAFGPIMRFVVGTWYAAPAVTRRVLGQRQPLLSLSY
jgi:predicted ATP-grasp superfamily ATP-dependent carboligase